MSAESDLKKGFKQQKDSAFEVEASNSKSWDQGFTDKQYKEHKNRAQAFFYRSYLWILLVSIWLVALLVFGILFSTLIGYIGKSFFWVGR